VFLSSHLLSEVEALCTRVGIVDRGRLVVQDDLETLRAPTGHVHVTTPDAATVVTAFDGQVVARDGDHLVIRHPDPAELNATLVRDGIRVSAIGARRRTLEEVVLDVTGHGSDRVVDS
jgi:ABC-2 type transport system ATP-binding protein